MNTYGPDEVAALLARVDNRLSSIEVTLGDHDGKLEEVKDIIQAYTSIKFFGRLSGKLAASATTLSGIYVAWHDFIRK